ncbi:MAG: TPM domain-containing protein [Planctomycetia bacterium]|nr:TPM domain-containing protein [Planctomycetia bacterium]
MAARAALAGLMLLLAPRWAHAELTVPDPGTRVVDTAAVFDQTTREKLEQHLAELARQTTAQVKVLTVGTTSGEDIFPFAQRHFDLWKLGQKDKDNGALVVLAVDDRKARIHTGYGLEGTLPDGWNGTLLRKIRDEYFRSGRYSDGLYALVVAVANKIADDSGGVKLEGVPPVRHQPKQHQPTQLPLGLCCSLLPFAIIVFLAFISRRQRNRGVWRGVGEAVYWGSVLGNVLSESGRSTWSGGSGGGFGGGGGGGGGSFGGGGSSGGGGASTSW